MKERVCVCVCPYNNLLIAGALPAGSELTFGFPLLPGLAVTLLHGSSGGCTSGFTPGQQEECCQN